MNRTRKILLIVEGAKSEFELFMKAISEFEFSSDFKIYVYNTNIYELYERMFLGNESELDYLDLLTTLKSRDSNDSVLNEKFTDVLLVFDYEPQDNRFSIERINLMLKYFNESTDNGKLFINYPMFESFKHLKSSPDPEYKNRFVELSVVKSGGYKKLVGSETRYHDIKNYDKNHIKSIIIHNVKKANYIANKNYEIENIDLKSVYFKLSNEDILTEQNDFMQNSEKIHILHSGLFFICDYNFDWVL